MSFITEKTICDHLEKYLFNRVWSEPYKEYRTNIRPRLLTSNPVNGTYKARYDQIALPDTTSLFYIYAIALEELSSFKLGSGEWTKISDYNKDNHLQFQMYSRDGVWLWRDAIYIRSGVVNNSILIAVDRSMIKKCCGSAYNVSNLYFAKYHDSDQVQDIASTYYRITDQATLLAAYRASASADLIFVNGRLSSFANSKDLTVGDYVELVTDGNIVATVTIPISNNNGVTYISDNINKRTIVHLPKKYNPNMYRVTYNTCDMFLVPSTLNDADHKARLRGTYIHLCGRESSLHQLTHCDFSVDNSLITEVADTIAATSYSLKVVIRIHTSMNTWYQNGYVLTSDVKFVANKKYYIKSGSTYTLATVTAGALVSSNTYYEYINYIQGDVIDNPLHPGIVRDVNYCELLYTHDDATILKFMTGIGPSEISFWTADELEDSIYAQAMLAKSSSTPEASSQCQTCGLKEVCDKNITSYKCIDYTDKGIGYYVDVLGFYNTISLVCEKTRHFRIGSEISNLFAVPIPLCMYDCDVSSLFIVAYQNGIKLDDSAIRIYANDTANNYDQGNIVTQDVLATNWSGTLYRQLAYDTDTRCVMVAVDANQITLKEGDYLAFEIFENPSIVSEIRTLPLYSAATASSFNVTFATDEYLVYKRAIGGTVRSANGELSSGVNNYTLIDSPGIFNADTKTLTIDKTFAGATLLLTENSGITKVYENNDWEITQDDYSQIATGKLMINATIPVLGDVSYLVFLNGRSLIENIDYVVVKTSYGTSEIQSEIIIQNLKWLKLHNKIEVYATRTYTKGYGQGYVSGNLVTDVGESPFWFDAMSMLAVDGLVQSVYKSFFGCVFEASGNHRNGSPFVTRTLIPSSIIDIIDNYRTDNDYNRIIQLRDYFLGSNVDPVMRIVIPYSHSIYSIYLNAIVRDFLSYVQYRLTGDTTLLAGTTYYTKNNDTYTTLTNAQVNSLAVIPSYTYWEKQLNTHRLTSDTTFMLSKNYYTKTGSERYVRASHTVMYPDGLNDALNWEVNGVMVNEKAMLTALTANLNSSDATLKAQAEQAQSVLDNAAATSRSYVYYTKNGDVYTQVVFNANNVGVTMPTIMELTVDTSVQANKTYYTNSNGTYTAVELTVGDPIGIYYVRTEDTVAQAGVTYYIRNDSGDSVEYTVAVLEVGDQLTGVNYYIQMNNYNTYYEKLVAYYLKEDLEAVYVPASVVAGDAVTANTYYEDVFALTSDTRFTIGKVYYKFQNSYIYSKATVILGTIVAANTYYEYTNNAFVLTSDTHFAADKDYYTRITYGMYRACIPLRNIYYVNEATPVKLLDFEMYADTERFRQQFVNYEWLRSLDAAYKTQDLRYLDVFPMYHRSMTRNTADYRKLKYLFKKLLPTDTIQHKDVINE